MGAAASGANCINPITIAYHHLKRLRLIEDSSTDTRMPISGLLQSRDVVDVGSCRVHIEAPLALLIEREQVIAAQQNELLGAELLVIIAGQRERKLRHQWEQGPHAVSAEPICIDACARGQAQEEAMF